MSKSKLTFGGGIPTAPDVKRLMDAIGKPVIGEIVPYGSVEDAIGSKRGESRFVSVTMAWRKKLSRENNICVIAIAGEGFKYATNGERVEKSASGFKSGLKKISKAGVLADSTSEDGLSDDQKRAKAHISATGASLRLMAATKAREIKF